MKKYLFIAHSYYMLLVLLQIKMSFLENENVDIVLSNSSRNSKKIFKKLNEASIFSNCYYINDDFIYPKNDNAFKKFLRIVKIVLSPQKLLENAGLNGMDFKYDAMFCYLDIRIPEQAIFNVIKSKNANAVCYTYEEGMASYFSRDGVLTSINALATKKLLPYMMKIIKKGNFILRNNVKGAYFFTPELIQYVSTIPVHEIPKIDSAKLNDLASKVFNYNEMSIKAEYIYLEDFSYADGQPTDDIEMIEIIKEHCEKYGKEMIVKLHPRSPDNRFLNLGIKTMDDEVPLEVAMLNSRAKKFL